MKKNSHPPVSPLAIRHSSMKRLGYVGAVPVTAVAGLFLLFWFVGALPSLAQGGAGPTAAIRYVTPTGSGVLCTTTSPCDLWTAISLSTTAGDEIRVAEGTYADPLAAATVSLAHSITLVGGYDAANWANSPDPLANPTILDGSGTHRVVFIGTGISPIIDGFIIQNGVAQTSPGGAGIYNSAGSSPIIRNNLIRDNQANVSGNPNGGGIYDDGTATISNNEIRDNLAQTSSGARGGAIFVSNGGLGTTTIEQNRIHGNTADAASATSQGGGIYVELVSIAMIEANTIYNNTADNGGGISVFSGVATIQSNLLYQNTANGSGAGFGGGLFLLGTATTWNNTIVANNSTNDGAGIYIDIAVVTISNSIVAFNNGNTNDGIFGLGGATVTGSRNNIFDDSSNAILLINTITDDPLFVNAGANNYHISNASPNRNTGDPAPASVDVDFDGQVRPNESAIDVGADEFYPDVVDFEFVPEFTENDVDRNANAIFTHVITNIGTVADSYDFECVVDGVGWSIVTCPATVENLLPGAGAEVNTVVSVPDTAALETATTIITATSQNPEGTTNRVVVQSTVRPLPGINFTPNYSDSLLPGEIITYTHAITNTGDATDNITVSLESDTYGWGELLPTNQFVLQLAPNQTQNVQVRVEVPPYAASGYTNTVVIQATSGFDSAVFDTVQDEVAPKATVGTRYVAASGGTDINNNCTQSSLPCATLAHAVTQASAGDEIWVRQGTYPVSEITINSDIHIEGSWNNGFTTQLDPTFTVLDAGGASRIFNISPGVAFPSINNLTLRNGLSGSSGGAILVGNGAQPVLTNLIFEANEASFGGAIYVGSAAYVQIGKSQFMTNTAATSGGAIYVNNGLVNLEQSSFTSNTAESSSTTNGGGAIFVTGSAGGLLSENVLFHNNSAVSDGGAVRIQSGLMNLYHATMVGNSAGSEGGGVYNGGATAVIRNTIFADNTATDGSAAFHTGSNSTNLDYSNLWNNSTTGVTLGSNNLTEDPTFSPDGIFHLQAASPMVDSGTEDLTPPVVVDFEDDFRPSDQGVDIGYDEVAGCRAKRGDIIYGSIQDAIEAGGAVNLIQVTGICRGVNSIDVGGQTLWQTVHLETNGLTIQGGWNGDFSIRTFEPTYVDPQEQGRGFYISGGISATVEGLIIVNGNATGLGGGPADQDAGGGVYNLDTGVTLRSVAIYSSTAELGGGLYNHTGALRLGLLNPNDEEFEGIATQVSRVMTNTATSGGGIYNYNGAMVIDGAIVRNNTADNGGGLYNQQGNLTAYNLVLAENAAEAGHGGGVYNQATAASYLHLTVYNNTAQLNGGGFYNAAGSPAIRSSIFQQNQANSGPAIFSAAGSPAVNYNYYNGHIGTAVVGTSAGANSITSAVAPGLIDPELGNYHLGEGAAAADEGDPASPVSRDFDAEPRPSNQGPDMGADEVVGCLARVNDVIYGSVQTAIRMADVGDQIDVAGRCSGTHPFDTEGSLGAINVTIHITKSVILTGGWNLEFTQQDDVTYLDAEESGRVIYVAPGISATISTFDILGGSGTNGGAIYIDNAPATILSNNIYSNSATNGAAIYSINSPTRIDGGNRIYSNTATSGAIYLTGATEAAVQNNFIYWNTAVNGAAIYNANGDHTYWHNTVVENEASGNGGGFYVASGSPEIRGNIVMSNTAVDGGGAYGVAPSAAALSYNDFFANSDDFGGNIGSGGTGHVSVDPTFAAVPTFTLHITSPVVDAGDPAMPLLYDFAEDIRPSHQGWDMGADEVGGCYARILSDPSTVYGSVQQAVDLAAAGDVVQVDGICYGTNIQTLPGPITLQQNLFIDKDITINGDWNYLSDVITGTLDALGEGRVLYVASGATVTITHLYLQHGDGTGAGINDNGGGVFNDGTLALLNSRVQTNTAVLGGGLYNEQTLLVEDTVVAGNVAANGAGLYNNVAGGGGATVRQNRFKWNQATGDGGATYQNAGPFTLDGNRLHSNTAVNGAATYLTGGTSPVVINNFIYQNQANNGAGVYNHNTTADILHNTIVGNVGSGIYNAGGTADIRNNIVDSNLGVGVHVAGGSATADFNNAIGNTTNYVGVVPGGGSLSASPFYVNAAEADYHLQDNSPGEDVGTDAGVLHDIDDDIRPTNGGPDIGADEINSCLVRVNTELFGVFQTAVEYAENNGYTLVEVARGECSGVLQRNGTLQVGYISGNLEIIGSLNRTNFSDPDDYHSDTVGTVSSLINPQNLGRAIVVAPGASADITHLGLINGNAFVADGTTNDDGGGLYTAGGAVECHECVVGSNLAANGGGYYAGNASNLFLSGGRSGLGFVAQVTEDSVTYIPVFGNVATEDGGGVHVAGGGTYTITNHLLWENTAVSGGGFYNGGTGTLINGIFYQNEAQNGAGVYNAGNMNMYHNTLNNNLASSQGGGVFNSGSSFLINSTVVYDNQASSGGGGVHTTNGGTSDYNNYFQNTPTNVSGIGEGANSISADPDIPGIWNITRHSPNIDAADPALIDPLTPPDDIHFDASLTYRPDGNNNPAYTGGYGLGSDIGADEYYKDWGCAVEPPSVTGSVLPGGLVTYTFTIENVGNPSYLTDPAHSHGYTDTITITVSSVVPEWVEFQFGTEQAIELDWMQAVTRVLTVTVPVTAPLGLQDTSVVRCTSHSIPTRTDTGTAVTSVGEVSGVLITPPYFRDGLPGDLFVFTHTVTNIGNGLDTFNVFPNSGPAHAIAVMIDDGGAVISGPVQLTLSQNETATVRMQVTLLDTAMGGDVAQPQAVVQSTTDPENVHNAVIDTINIGYIPGTRYVAAEGTLDNTNCTDPIQPCATIQHAVNQALDGDDILVSAGVYTDHVTYTVGISTYVQNVFVDKSITIRGGYDVGDGYTTAEPITNAVILSGEELRRVFFITDGVTVTLSSLFIRDGQPLQTNGLPAFGGGIYNAGANLTLTATHVISNFNLFGGGLFHVDGDLTVQSSVFAHNSNLNNVINNYGQGAGIYVLSGTAVLENNTFVDNKSNQLDSLNQPQTEQNGYGGALYLDAGTAVLLNNIFAENSGEVASAVYVSDTVLLDNDYNLYFNHEIAPSNVPTGSNSLTGDPVFLDSYYHIAANSAAKDNGTSAVSGINGVDFDLQPRSQGPGVDIGADERVQIAAFVFTPVTQTAVIDPGVRYTYTHVLTNTGDFTNTYTLSLAEQEVPPGGGWDCCLLQPTTIPNLVPFDSVTVTLVITGGQPGYQHIATITAVPDIGTSHSVTDTTIITHTPGVDIEASQAQSGGPNQAIIYTHTLTNTGDGIDQFTLSVLAANPPAWTVTIVPTTTAYLPAGISTTFTVTVLIPAGTPAGVVHQVDVIAQAFDPDASDTLSDTTTVLAAYGLELNPDNAQSTPDNTTVTYYHTLTNTGNITDTVTLSAVSVPDWTVTILPTTVTDLIPLATQNITVTVTVPPGTGGTVHVATIIATSEGGLTATAVNTTTVQSVASVLLEPNNSAVVDPGTTLTYTHVLTNLGNTTDIFDLTASSDQGWLAGFTPSSVQVDAGQTADVVVTITVPGGATPSQVDTTIITATSQTDPNSYDTATDTTRVTQNHGLTFVPDHVRTVDAGSTVVYTHTLTNTGDGADDFEITADNNIGWQVDITPTAITLNPAESAVVTATLQVPLFSEGMTNTMWLTATSVISPAFSATVVNTTIISGTPQLGVEIGPDHVGTGTPGNTVQYQHTVTNTGILTDTYVLSAVSSRLWFVQVSPQLLTLNPGETGTIQVTIAVPDTANNGDVDVTTVSAASQTSSMIADIATDTTTIEETVPGTPVIYLPIVIKPEAVPPTPTPTPTPSVTPTPTATATPSVTPTPCSPTGIDLVVTAIQVQPNPPINGQPATVYVTIRNQGSVNVPFGNNFYLDFYVDRVPAPVVQGDLFWGVQGADLTAGTSRTYSAQYTFTSGSHQLWAQVDTDNTVNECPQENNNILGPVVLTVNGISDSENTLPLPPAAQDSAGGLPRATPTLEATPVLPPTEDESTPTSAATATPAIQSALPTATPTPFAVDE